MKGRLQGRGQAKAAGWSSVDVAGVCPGERQALQRCCSDRAGGDNAQAAREWKAGAEAAAGQGVLSKW